MKSLIFLICAMNFSIASAKEKLKFLADTTIITGEVFKNTEIGGLSGIVFDKKTNRLLAVSDDRSGKNNARFYEFNIKLDAKSISISPYEVVTLVDEKGAPFAKNTIDFEGITTVNDDILISSEGNLHESPKIMPELLKFSRNGKLKERLKIPDHFFPDEKNRGPNWGARDNLIFEALSSTSDGKTVFMGTEGALFQDGEVSTLTGPSRVRIIRYVESKPNGEFIYQVEKIPAEGRPESVEADNGLVDLAVVDEVTFYTMERSYLPKSNANVIKIFKVTEANKADNVLEVESLRREYRYKPLKMLKKQLVLNLDEVIPDMHYKNQKLDNIEGICFGPTLENGHKTLIVVSDNNFSKVQRTLFMAFEIVP